MTEQGFGVALPPGPSSGLQGLSEPGPVSPQAPKGSVRACYNTTSRWISRNTDAYILPGIKTFLNQMLRLGPGPTRLILMSQSGTTIISKQPALRGLG